MTRKYVVIGLGIDEGRWAESVVAENPSAAENAAYVIYAEQNGGSSEPGESDLIIAAVLLGAEVVA